MTSKKLLSIVGPTATGKTATALWIAEKLLERNRATGVAIISADSRQVYRELKILSGADVPDDFIEVSSSQAGQKSFTFPYFKHQTKSIALHGVGCVTVQDEWSVAHFVGLASATLQQATQVGWLPIIVGGTGLYLQQLINPATSLGTAPNQALREQLELATVGQLQEKLLAINSAKFEKMNTSDRQNPRRLVRAIELELAETVGVSGQILDRLSPPAQDWSVLSLGLSDTLEVLTQRVTERVTNRYQQGVLQEVEQLLENAPALSKPARSTLGLKELAALSAGDLEEPVALEHWANREVQYIKRQLTWFKKYAKNTQWFQASGESDRATMLELVEQFLEL